MNVAPPPNPVFEVDLPIIAVVDLPLNMVGQYTMQVALDGKPSAAARLFVNGPAQSPWSAGRRTAWSAEGCGCGLQLSVRSPQSVGRTLRPNRNL